MTRELSSKLNTLAKSSKKETLSTFSPMLSQHHWYGSMDNYIELPGQYTGNSPPNPSTSLKIVKFNEEITIFQSLRIPIKISCICSDGKSYSFIAKYGEDLRRDERIQRVQELMSEQMQLDKNCSQQKLSLRSYEVIPLNTKCGLIKCIENSNNMQSFLSKDNKDQVWNDSCAEARKMYDYFIQKSAQKNKKNIHNNAKTVLVRSREEVRAKIY